jgi:hypothetical protein
MQCALCMLVLASLGSDLLPATPCLPSVHKQFVCGHLQRQQCEAGVDTKVALEGSEIQEEVFLNPASAWRGSMSFLNLDRSRSLTFFPTSELTTVSIPICTQW